VCERLEEIADRAPQLVAVQILLAQKYLEREVPVAARAAAAQAAQIAPDLPAPYRLLVEATAQEGKWIECLEFARQLRERTTARPLEADLTIAKAYLALQRPDDARAQLKPYLADASSPAYADAVMALSEGGASAQDISALVKSLVEQGPAARIVWMTHVARNLPSDQAAKWLRQCNDVIPPGSIDERVVLAQSWGELGSTTGEANYAKEARAILEPLAANPDAPGTVLLAWANQLDQDGDFPAAEALYRRVIAAGPSPVAQNNLAMLLARHGENLPEARKLIDEAIALAPSAAPLYDTKAFVLSKAGDLPGAVDSIHQAIELRPSNPEYRVHLAELLLRKGEREKVREAIADLDKRHVALKSLTQPVRQRLDNLRNALSEQAPVKGAEI
jgi:tetratricopeptide (TPR) repeat protein